MFLFLLQAAVISLTGVMAPGPITAATLGAGSRSPHAGALVAAGHGLVEFPLMALVYFGLGGFLGEPPVRAVIFSLGAVFLLVMGADMLRSARSAAGPRTVGGVSAPLAAGLALSLGNAYFLLWWATVGASLIAKAAAFGIAGVLSFALVHWLCDFAWLYALSALSFKGRNLFGAGFTRTVFLACGIALVGFGVLFGLDAVRIVTSG